jgi:hypothetical protein
MRITNSLGLPQSVFEALCNKEYSKEGADISVTELIDSPRVRVLKKQNFDKIEFEAETLLASFLGTCFHKGIEAGTKTGTAERRLAIDVNGWKLSGGMDHYHDGVLTDYKTATTWKTMLDCADGRIEDFENQLNVYAHILRENGHPVKKLMLFVLFKDWNNGSFGQNVRRGNIFVPNERGGYPERTWVHFEVPLWPANVASAYVLARVAIHQAAEKELPLCTQKEIWKGNRCKKYCLASQFCTQFQEQSKTGVLKKVENE